MLDQDADEAFEGTEQGPVDHHGPVLGVVGAGVGELEALGHPVVELDGAQLPRALERVGHVKVDLRPVERALAHLQLVLQPARVESFGQGGLGAIPEGVVADPVVGPG